MLNSELTTKIWFERYRVLKSIKIAVDLNTFRIKEMSNKKFHPMALNIDNNGIFADKHH